MDEEGTVASAATAVVGGTSSFPSNVKNVVVNEPFSSFFFIRDLPTGTILLAGRVTDPTEVD